MWATQPEQQKPRRTELRVVDFVELPRSPEASSKSLRIGHGLVTVTIFWISPARSGYPGSDEERRIVLRTMAHLRDDETVAKMGHPDFRCGPPSPWSTYRHYLLDEPGPSPDIPNLTKKDGSRFARWPTLATMKPSRRWGTQILDVGHPAHGPPIVTIPSTTPAKSEYP